VSLAHESIVRDPFAYLFGQANATVGIAVHEQYAKFVPAQAGKSIGLARADVPLHLVDGAGKMTLEFDAIAQASESVVPG